MLWEPLAVQEATGVERLNIVFTSRTSFFLALLLL